MALTKVLGATAGPNGAVATFASTGSILEGASIRESLWENKVEVSIKVMIGANRDRKNTLPLNLGRFGTPLPGVTAKIPNPGTRGTAGLFLVAASFVEPCGTTPALQGGPNDPTWALTTDTGEAGNPAPAVDIKIADTISDSGAGFDSTGGDFGGSGGGSGSGSGGAQGGIFSDYRVMSTYNGDDHTLQLPIASDQASDDSVFVQVAKANMSLQVDWLAEKSGSKPLLPNPYVSDSNLVFLRGQIITDQVETDSDGTVLKYKVQGRYFYGAKNRQQLNINCGVPPWVNLSKIANADHQFALPDFVHGIIDGTNLNGTVPFDKTTLS